MNIAELEILLDLHGDMIYGFCLKITRNKEFADELYQNTFLKATQIRERITNDNPRNYIIGIAIRLWKNQNRKIAIRNKIATFISSDENNYTEKINDVESLEDRVIKNEECIKINQIISELKDIYRIPMIMHYSLEMSIEEISNTLNIPKGTIKSRLYKAREIIRGKLEVKQLCKKIEMI